MTGLRFLTAGESHGTQLTAILEGCPAGLELSASEIDADLARRQGGYGRGARQQIEKDRVEIVGGVRYGVTTGAPIALVIANRDATNWVPVMAVSAPEVRADPVRVPRPGHADLGGHQMYGHADLRDVIERASARETAARVACGAIARRLLREVGCEVRSHVTAIAGVRATVEPGLADLAAVDEDSVRCVDPVAADAMREAISSAGQRGDTVGGVFEVVASGFPPGVGSYVSGDRRLGALLAAAAMSIPAMRGVEFGMGFAAADAPGSEVHDEIVADGHGGVTRASNRAGGIEGGMSTGLPLVIHVAMKPIATLLEPLRSIDLDSGAETQAHVERSDVCAVPAASVIGEAVIALALADALLDRCGGHTVAELIASVEALRRRHTGL